MAREDGKQNGHRVTVRIGEAEKRRLDAVCAPTNTRGALTPSAVIRALIGDLEAQGFSPSGSSQRIVGGGASTSCERVHLDEVTAHKLLVELGREGRSVNMIAAQLNSIAAGLIKEGEFVNLEDIDVKLDLLDEHLRNLRYALGASEQ